MSHKRFSSAERAQRTLLTLPQALHHAARDYPGGATAIAAIDGGNATTLNHKLSLTNTSHTPNIADLELLLDATRDPRIVDALLHPIGWVGIDVSELSDTDTPQSLMAGIGALLSREGELATHVSATLADDKVEHDELAEFELLAERMVQAVFKLRAVLRKKHAEDAANG